MRVLVTGSTGFVGKYMMHYLMSNNIEVIGSSRSKEDNLNFIQLDLNNLEQVEYTIKEYKPTHIIHLGGQSNVKKSWEEPQKTFFSNTIGTINLLESLRKFSPYTFLLNIGSSEEYGEASQEMIYINENHATKPRTPYGTSKLSTCNLLQQYVEAFQLQAIHVRPFNHIGPGQMQGFVTQDFAKQIVDIEKSGSNNTIKVGNLSSVRDFTDVRDIVEAYFLLLLYGKSGEVYNVCSGNGFAIQEILERFIELSTSSIKVEVDITKFRPVENKFLIGSNDKLIKTTNWEPKYNISMSLTDILSYYRNMA